MEKENKRMKAHLYKKEKTRIVSLVTLAYENDPRIQKMLFEKEEEKARAREAKKQAKEKKRLEELERKQKYKEEAERKQKEEEDKIKQEKELKQKLREEELKIQKWNQIDIYTKTQEKQI